MLFCFFFQAEDGIRDVAVTGVQTCALPISRAPEKRSRKKGSGSRQTRHASFPRRKSKKPGRRDPTPRFAESIQPVPGVLPFCISSGWPHPDDLSSKRSEEHTSELQSRLHLVCRLLLEKKNKDHTSVGLWTS